MRCDVEGHVADGDLLERWGSSLELWLFGVQFNCLNINNELYRVGSTGLLVTVEEMLFCAHVLHVGNCVGCGA